MSTYAKYPVTSGGGTGNIASINGDTTAAQVITGSAGLSASTTGGTTTVTQTGLAPLASPTFTGTVSGAFIGNLTGNVTGNCSGSSATCTGLSNVTNNKQVVGLSAGTTSGHVVTWGTDGYTVADGGAINSTLIGLGNVTNDAQVKKIASAVSGNIVTWSGTTGAVVADSGVATSSFAPAAGTGIVEVFTGQIFSPVGTSAYVLDPYAFYGYTINSIVIGCVSGSCTAAVQINGITNPTGMNAISVSSSTLSTVVNASGNNSVVVGNSVAILLTSLSSPSNLTFSLKVTRS